MNHCEHCGKATNNPKYCCRSCSAKDTNKKFPKRTKKVYRCKVCGVIVSRRKTVCTKHNSIIVDWSTITYNKLSGRTKYQKNSRIRELARSIYNKSDKPKKCAVCDYDTHFHVCHIKDISSFNPDTPISVINDLNNLVALCPNHHWEFDNGILAL